MTDERGFSAAEMRRLETERRDKMPLRSACALCEWEYLGTTAEGREQALHHRLEAHPETLKRRRPPARHLKGFRQTLLNEEEQAEVMAEKNRRARLLGID